MIPFLILSVDGQSVWKESFEHKLSPGNTSKKVVVKINSFRASIHRLAFTAPFQVCSFFQKGEKKKHINWRAIHTIIKNLTFMTLEYFIWATSTCHLQVITSKCCVTKDIINAYTHMCVCMCRLLCQLSLSQRLSSFYYPQKYYRQYIQRRNFLT